MTAAVLLLALASAATIGWIRRPQLPPAERGRRTAERVGCFSCHGPGGLRGASNAGRRERTVPDFTDDVAEYSRNPDEVHEWIHYGAPRRKRADPEWRAARERGALRMPAFGGRMGERAMDDVVAYVLVMAGIPKPQDSLAVRGLRTAQALGCVGCHGPGGRLARPNPGSWKGYVPAWDGADFADLVRDSSEFRQWVERGVSRRLGSNPFARFFLRRADLHMPAFRKHLAPDDVPALWAYVTWLRTKGSRENPMPMKDEERH